MTLHRILTQHINTCYNPNTNLHLSQSAWPQRGRWVFNDKNACCNPNTTSKDLQTKWSSCCRPTAAASTALHVSFFPFALSAGPAAFPFGFAAGPPAAGTGNPAAFALPFAAALAAGV